MFLWQLTAMIDGVQAQQAKLQHRYDELRHSDLSSLTLSQKQHQPLGVALSRIFNLQSKQSVVASLQAKAQFIFLRLMQASLVLEYGNAIAQAVNFSRQISNTQTEGIMPYAIESKQDMQRYTAEIDGQLETLIFALADNEQWQSYEALEQYRLALLNDLRTRGEQLANSQKLTLKDTQPALVVEFNANGNAKGWERFTLRNHIRHPLFCLGGTEMEVLQ